MTSRDAFWMREALARARNAMDGEDVPVGAILVLGEDVIGEGWNRGRVLNDPTAHAEMVAIRMGASRVGNYRMAGASLYVTLEPCFMCFGAMLEGRISRLVYGAREPRRGVAGSLYDLHNDPRLHHRIKVVSGVLEVESRILLQNFFEKKREGEPPKSK
ncbi:MAG: tRNA adenosine(34) deaminase TadA [Nitrospiraceae bacterium]|nr:tRNA adenosine(34) deaminase TadA [Nitrospiraceae bacterium]